jgi:hypothetical protein
MNAWVPSNQFVSIPSKKRRNSVLSIGLNSEVKRTVVRAHETVNFSWLRTKTNRKRIHQWNLSFNKRCPSEFRARNRQTARAINPDLHLLWSAVWFFNKMRKWSNTTWIWESKHIFSTIWWDCY